MQTCTCFSYQPPRCFGLCEEWGNNKLFCNGTGWEWGDLRGLYDWNFWSVFIGNAEEDKGLMLCVFRLVDEYLEGHIRSIFSGRGPWERSSG